MKKLHLCFHSSILLEERVGPPTQNIKGPGSPIGSMPLPLTDCVVTTNMKWAVTVVVRNGDNVSIRRQLTMLAAAKSFGTITSISFVVA